MVCQPLYEPVGDTRSCSVLFMQGIGSLDLLIPYAKGTCSDGGDLGVGKTSIGKKILMCLKMQMVDQIVTLLKMLKKRTERWKLI